MSFPRPATMLRWGISAVLLGLLYNRIDLTLVTDRLKHMTVLPLLAVAPLLFLNTFLSALKWNVLLRSDGIRLPMRTLFTSYLIGSFFNVFLPSNIGGDAYRIGDVARATKRAGSTVASVIGDRLSGFLALSILGLICPAIGWELMTRRGMLIPPLIVFACILALLAAMSSRRLSTWGLRVTRLERVAVVSRFSAGFLDAVDVYRAHPRTLLTVMAISFCFHACSIVCVWLMSRSLHATIPLSHFFIYVPLVAILEAVPLSVFGLGLRDAGYVFFMREIGRPDTDGLVLSALYVAVMLAYTSVGGLLFAARARRTDRAAGGHPPEGALP